MRRAFITNGCRTRLRLSPSRSRPIRPGCSPAWDTRSSSRRRGARPKPSSSGLRKMQRPHGRLRAMMRWREASQFPEDYTAPMMTGGRRVPLSATEAWVKKGPGIERRMYRATEHGRTGGWAAFKFRRSGCFGQGTPSVLVKHASTVATIM